MLEYNNNNDINNNNNNNTNNNIIVLIIINLTTLLPRGNCELLCLLTQHMIDRTPFFVFTM